MCIRMRRFLQIFHTRSGDRETMGQKMRDTWWKWGEVELFSGPIREQLVATTAATVRSLAKRIWGVIQGCQIPQLIRKSEEKMIYKRSGKLNPKLYTAAVLLEWLQPLICPHPKTIQKNWQIKFWWECKATKTLIYYWWKCRIMVQLLWENSWQFLP